MTLVELVTEVMERQLTCSRCNYCECICGTEAFEGWLKEHESPEGE
jgi:hypothetical protein